jgi:hypothetical protein
MWISSGSQITARIESLWGCPLNLSAGEGVGSSSVRKNKEGLGARFANARPYRNRSTTAVRKLRSSHSTAIVASQSVGLRHRNAALVTNPYAWNDFVDRGLLEPIETGSESAANVGRPRNLGLSGGG